MRESCLGFRLKDMIEKREKRDSSSDGVTWQSFSGHGVISESAARTKGRPRDEMR